MDKPKLQERIDIFYDWNDCVRYIDEKYKINMRDFGNRYGEKPNLDNPYLDYWHFVLRIYEIERDSFFYMDNELIDDSCYEIEDWQKTITEYLLSEFGTGDDREIKFWVEW